MPTAHRGLLLFKRHLRSCPLKKSKLKPSVLRFRMDCECPIWIVGRTPSGDIVPRQSTGETELRRAEAVRDSILRQTKSDLVHGAAIAECVDQYLASREHEVSERTLGQHRLVLDRLITFCNSKNAIYMSDLKVDLLERFKVDGLPEGMKSTSRSTSIAKLRCFLKAAYRRDWIKESLREKVPGHKAVYEQKKPYEEQEVKLILEEALKLDGGTHGYAKHPQTFRLLLELQLETGIRVGDAVYYDPKRVTKGEKLWIYTYVPRKQKRTEQPKTHEIYLSDRLKVAIENCQWLSTKQPFAWGNFSNLDYLPSEVYYRMQAMGERCGVEDCRPHRLRDTFAVRKLLKGMSLDDLSKLMFHSSVKVTEQYYARWVPRRKDRLEALMAKSFVDA